MLFTIKFRLNFDKHRVQHGGLAEAGRCGRVGVEELDPGREGQGSIRVRKNPLVEVLPSPLLEALQPGHHRDPDAGLGEEARKTWAQCYKQIFVRVFDRQ